MAKAKSVYSCTECGGQSTKWAGQCPHCNAWNTLVETAVEAIARSGALNRLASLGGPAEAIALAEVEAEDFPRLPTVIAEFDRVLGGGLVEGGVVLMGGDPGSGNSTRMRQAAGRPRGPGPEAPGSGAVKEIGVFAMTEKGLREVTKPSALFLSQHHSGVAGSCVMVTQEGTGPLLVELQALVDESHGMAPKRLTVGLELNRLAMLLAVLHRHAGIACFDQDVVLNSVWGVRIVEPGADLAVTLAIVSSLRNRPLPEKHVVFGEVGLPGEVRPVQRGQERLREAAKLGFTHAIIPSANKPKQAIPGLTVVAVEL